MQDNFDIGQLLVMQAILVNLPNEESIFEFITHGLSSFPAVQSIHFGNPKNDSADRADTDNDPQTFSESHVITIPTQDDGSLQLTAQLNPAPEYEPYRPYLHNFFSMVRLIIRSKNQKSQLEQKNRELEHALKTENRLRSELILKEKILGLNPLSTIIAHEMSTPIGNITTISSSLKNITENLEKSVHSGISKSQLIKRLDQIDRGYSDILASAQQMNRLISRLQHLIDADHREPKSSFNFLQFCKDIRDMVLHNSGWDQAQIEFKVPEDCWICTDKGALIQIMEILLENALIHGYGSTASARIIIGAELADDGEMNIWVRDYGSGIAPENLGKIFDPFYTTRLAQGLDGLGLSIAYRLTTQVLNGRVDVESAPGWGTKFCLTIPDCSAM